MDLEFPSCSRIMGRVLASHGQIGKTSQAKLMLSTLCVLYFSRGRNRNVKALVFSLLIWFLLLVILPSTQFSGWFQNDIGVVLPSTQFAVRFQNDIKAVLPSTQFAGWFQNVISVDEIDIGMDEDEIDSGVDEDEDEDEIDSGVDEIDIAGWFQNVFSVDEIDIGMDEIDSGVDEDEIDSGVDEIDIDGWFQNVTSVDEIDIGMDEIDSGVDEIDIGMDEIDIDGWFQNVTSVDEIDIGMDEIDSGVDEDEIGSGVDEDGVDEDEIDSSVDEDEIDSGVDEIDIEVDEIDIGVDEDEIGSGVDEDGVDEDEIDIGVDEDEIDSGVDEIDIGVDEIDSVDEWTWGLMIRMFVSSFRGRRGSTSLLHKLMQSALMVLETLASLFVACAVLSGLCVYLWEEFTDGPDPDLRVEKLVLALVVWMVVSSLHGRIRRRNTGLAKLMQSAVIVLTLSFIFWDPDREIVAFPFMTWGVISVFVLPLRIKGTGGSEHLQELGMGLFGSLALRYPSIVNYAGVLAVWIALSAFFSLFDMLMWDGTDTAPKEVASSLSISTLAKKELRVFLSVNRGPDVPDEFIDFLMVHLTRSGISVFGDGKELPQGEELVKVIKQSNISIPLISKGYASSESCLIELGLLLECRRTNGQTIIPIFYDVDPSDVRNVRGSFEMSLKVHEMKGTDGRTIRAWGGALREVGGLKRFYSADNNSWSNYKLLRQFLLDVLQLFHKWDVEENLVGIQNRVQEVMTKLGVNYRDGQSVGLHGGDVRVVGIYGTGGVGKTTLAKVVYKDIASLFDGCSYLEDIQERFTQSEGLKSLQNQLISDLLKRSCPMFTYEEGAHIIRHRFHSMRVLIILDNVNHHYELKPFIGKLNCFGPRSRIIVTTRDYGLINVPEVAERYEVEPLKPDQALFLFRRHASNVLPFPEGYDSLFDEITSVTGRIPLAIEVLAHLLCRTPTTLWPHTLKIMRNCVDPVDRVLMASFEFLNYETKEILLDIACFFVGEDIANPFSMWYACGYDPLSGIKVLLDMSLVQIGENDKLWMHDQLRNLCQQIVENEDPERRQRCSRLWKHEDAVSVLKERKGTKMVQALNLKFDNSHHDCFTCEEFELLPGLRFLKLGKARIIGDSKDALSNLRWLDWQECPETFGTCDLHLKELVVLDLSWSKVAHDWKGWSQIKMPQLKILNLTGCTGLLMTPDLSGFKKLEILILEDCSRLVKIGASIAHLKCLVTLNLKFCRELGMLPEELNDMKELKELLIDGTSIKEIPSSLANMKKLKIVSASHCFSLSSLPESIGLLEDLSVLSLDSARIVELPDSIGELVHLKQLSLRNCRCLGELPDLIGELGSTLIELDVSGTGISELPGSITNLRRLKVLKMNSCFIREFPRGIGRLTNLEEMHALRCRSLEGDIPSDIGKLKSLRMLVLAYTRISSLPSCMQSLCCLQTLDLLHCDMIKALPELPSSLTCLRVISRSMKVVPFIDNLTKLEELCLGDEDPKEPKLPSMQRMMNSILARAVVLSFLWSERFPRLKVLELSHSQITDLCLRDEHLPQLMKLVVSGSNLRRIQQLPSTLSFLSVQGCSSLERLPTVQCLKCLTELRLSHSAVREVEGLGELGALEIIDISHCKIRNLNGLGQLTSLRNLMLSDCDYLRELPNISNLRMLKSLEIRRCREIKNIEGLQEIRCTIEKLHVGECNDENSPEARDQHEDENFPEVGDAFGWHVMGRRWSIAERLTTELDSSASLQ